MRIHEFASAAEYGPPKLVDGRTKSTAVRHEKCRQFDSAFRAGLILFGRHSADTKRRGPVTQVLLSLLEPRLDGKRSEKQPCKFPAGQPWTKSDHDGGGKRKARETITPPPRAPASPAPRHARAASPARCRGRD